jgi:voltage-gated potassium channel
MNILKLRNQVYEVLHTEEIETKLEKVIKVSLFILIVCNIIAVVMQTVVTIENEYWYEFLIFEYVTVFVFSIEYILRIWSIVESERYKNPILGRMKYALSFYAIIDVLSIIPFFTPMLVSGADLRMLRGLRLMRLMRILKLGEYSKSLALFGRVFKHKKNDLLVAFGVVFLILVVASSLLYFIEHETQPQAFSSIPAAMWWGVATLTTVGYGDIYPVTMLGKVCAALVALLGIGLVALPSGILVAGFSDEFNKLKTQEQQLCPNCSHAIKHIQ